VADSTPFAQLLLLTSIAALVAILSNRLSALIRVPAPLFFLVGGAIAAAVSSGLSSPPEQTVERIVTVCLLCILFDGGMHIGRRRFATSAVPIIAIGLAGTFFTTAAIAALAHASFGLSWYLSVLLGGALAPTDPAVVFSLLGQREIEGPAGTILEGESGANDPVGIAFVASLLSAGALSGGTVAHIAVQFTLQMGVGATAGILGGRALLWFTRRIPLPSEGLYPLRTLGCIFALYGVVTVAHGSGFLAVFVAGIMIGDERAPFKGEVTRFHAALASLAEIAAFGALGLTLALRDLVRVDVLVPAVVIALALAVVIRPALVGVCLLPARLRRNDAAFVLFAGLKGAVPLLLGTMLLAAHVSSATRLYNIIADVVILSVLVQGSLIPAVARAFHLQFRTVEPQPWALGVRLADEPEDVLHLTVRASSRANGHTIEEIAALAGDISDVWINIVQRSGRLLPVRPTTTLEAGDEVIVSANRSDHQHVRDLFN
jgi:cell volume regulation protein A